MRYLKHRFFLYVLHQCDYSATIVINYEHRENAAARLELDRGAIAALHSHFFSALHRHSHIVRLRVYYNELFRELALFFIFTASSDKYLCLV